MTSRPEANRIQIRELGRRGRNVRPVGPRTPSISRRLLEPYPTTIDASAARRGLDKRPLDKSLERAVMYRLNGEREREKRAVWYTED